MAEFGFEPAVAVAHLNAADPALATLIAASGPFAMELKARRSVFVALAEAIVYQQLSNKAAATIFGRLCGHFPRGARGMSAERLLALSDASIRSCGISRPKLKSLRDLARRAASGEIPSLAAARRLDDEEIIDRLTAVHGIGRWSAEMFLMFNLGRPDVLPLGDYSLRKAFAATFRKRSLPSPETLRRAAERWRPYRTVACWYLWNSLSKA
ncbi:MAG: DNA-3-methyladenine glycosylase 2 family protein [Enhydrobacter sp.]|nr:MAG: DNA-3-methyladenine glycosylase 2 family protein [Enhydrobacter sp.]